MKSDAIISWLIHSDWLFLALWVAILTAAFAFTFVENRVTVPSRLDPPTPRSPRL